MREPFLIGEAFFDVDQGALGNALISQNKKCCEPAALAVWAADSRYFGQRMSVPSGS